MLPTSTQPTKTSTSSHAHVDKSRRLLIATDGVAENHEHREPHNNRGNSDESHRATTACRVARLGPQPPNRPTPLAAIRVLTEPLLHPPSIHELRQALLMPWKICMPIDPEDFTMRRNWQNQKKTALFASMFDWDPPSSSLSAHDNKVSLYFGLGSASLSSLTSPFFTPWQDVGQALKQLLFHQVASRHQSSNTGYMILSSFNIDLFLATGPQFPEANLPSLVHVDYNAEYASSAYLLRCHYDQVHQQLVFGYHARGMSQSCVEHHDDDSSPSWNVFRHLVEISLQDDDWSCTTCIVLINLARILYTLKDYAVPLMWKPSTKLRLVHMPTGATTTVATPLIQKTYRGDTICPNVNATVDNMMDAYRQLAYGKVPHTDRLVHVERRRTVMNNNNDSSSATTTICQFAPVGRAYLPRNVSELVDALLCMAEALEALHAMGWMHRDIRWANVMHVLRADDDDDPFSREWVLFDFEFAAVVPQPALGRQTLTRSNHAPEMFVVGDDNSQGSFRHENFRPAQEHGTAVDIWGLGYLMQQAHVVDDLTTAAHDDAMARLQDDCLQSNPALRPTAAQCWERLKAIQATIKASSHEHESSLRSER